MYRAFVSRFLTAAALIAFAANAALAGDQDPTIKGGVKPNALESRFVSTMRAALTKRFATPKDAEAAGYFRYTNADDTGAISYANLKWQSTDVDTPSQLWYSKRGELLGADYSQIVNGAKRPAVWGVRPGRWAEFGAHIHWVGKTASGALTYDHYALPKTFVAAGGSMTAPVAATLVKMHKVKSQSDVARIFAFPDVWDLTVWVLPNPSGAFAEKNPTVT